ncbi:DNA alkylation repair protein [Rhodopirellula baltica]|uniref:Probable DNA alkylation repair enzyme n=2 Tax=Rhodopirellula baltica TaxID=265606 RepID=Q7UE78_RHOBA|nr:DNA alkylation repair protein [Rhodopirellula baltica]CAD79170.1 probable DNA alkylation repair enzyme [Rhodopirellula baltica SH 1]
MQVLGVAKMTAKQVLSALREVAREDKAAFLPGFFQAVPGGYGEGDRFLGCVVPDQRKVARQFRDLSRDELVKLFASPWHECRLTGMLILVGQYEQAAKPKNPHRDFECREIVDFYLANLAAVNNWDVVDSTAPKILGAWLVENYDERIVLDRLATSEVLWERRVAVLATLSLIKNDEFEEIVELAERLMDDGHDLMNKAIGWMLREMGKRDQSRLEKFLKKHAKTMPRTMLRYSIEKLSRDDRTKWMNQ